MYATRFASLQSPFFQIFLKWLLEPETLLTYLSFLVNFLDRISLRGAKVGGGFMIYR